VYTIQQRNEPREKYQTYLAVAERCQGHISRMGKDDSLAQRYSVVLEELRLEAVKSTQQHSETRNIAFGMTSAIQQTSTQPGDSIGKQQQVELHLPGDMFSDDPNENMFGTAYNETTPTSLMADLTSWGEFDSLVGLAYPLVDFILKISIGYSWRWWS
jgi:hypothetical protein